ncbi:MAG: DUF3365 domain-containing protein [Kangiellaceae bacterium]|nr:DUF3365 domain-containing protein [Kangiellaceae bacterium]
MRQLSLILALCVILNVDTAEQPVLSQSRLAEVALTTSERALASEAEDIVKQFAGQLKPQLVGAITNGGLAHAIKVCSEQAPQIAQQLSRQTGWQVKRVSLKPRNGKTANADPFERFVLELFDQQRIAGADVNAMVYAKTIENSFRFMKAQPVQAVCLNCHGERLQPEVIEALDHHYPNDVATGYRLKDIRGAISLVRSLSD